MQLHDPQAGDGADEVLRRFPGTVECADGQIGLEMAPGRETVEMSYYPRLRVHQYTIRYVGNPLDRQFWAYPASQPDLYGNRCVLVRGYPHGIQYATPPSETLRTLIEVNAPWYVVLDRFVEEYPQWEEVMTWAPTANPDGG